MRVKVVSNRIVLDQDSVRMEGRINSILEGIEKSNNEVKYILATETLVGRDVSLVTTSIYYEKNRLNGSTDPVIENK
jgi:hypothetical protein